MLLPIESMIITLANMEEGTHITNKNDMACGIQNDL